MNKTVFWNGTGLVVKDANTQEAMLLTEQLLQQHPNPKKANYRVRKDVGKHPVFELIF